MKTIKASNHWPPFAAYSLVGLAALLFLSLARPVHAEEPTPGAELIRLLRLAADAEQVDSEQLSRSVEALGRLTLPVLFAVLDTRIIPSEQGALLLSDEIINALWASFTSIPESDIREHVSKFAKAKYKERTRTTALKLIGSIGDSQDLVLLGRLAAPEGVLPSTAIRKSFGYALTKILERDKGALREVQELFVDGHDLLRPTLIERIGHCDSPDRLAVLCTLLGRVPSADPYLLKQIGTIASSGRGTSDEYVCGSVRAYLLMRDPTLIQAAAQTLGALRDEGAIPQLIDIVASGNVQTSPTAVRALTQISGHRLGTDARRWLHWHQQEQLWWQSEASLVFKNLRHTDPAQVAASMQILSTHNLYREELATELLCVLDRKEASLRRMGCVILGSLGAEGARPGLTRLLDDVDPAVRSAAKSAVSRLTFRVIPGG